MPVNRNALIRYKTIDKCLQNRYRQWTLDDLIEACSDALYEYEGIDKGISRRTVQLDIQMMRSDKLGYNAPIIVYDNKYYTYEDPGYSITNIPLTEQDLGKLTEAVEFMKQFKGFSHFRELDGMVQKLEDHVYSQKKRQKPVIDFEKNEDLRGLEHLEALYQAIVHRRAVTITYQSFKARKANSFSFHPYHLKEFRNRWFLIGKKREKEPILTLALDRMLEIQPAEVTFITDTDFDAETYFKDVIGVTVNPKQEPETVVLFITHKHAQYVITKPLHHSQRIIEKDKEGVTIELKVQHNFELEKEILGLGDGVRVMAPGRLRRAIYSRLRRAAGHYPAQG
jgi:predicted DNA-binding transcriptional regulator YafY